jgi:adenylate kinase
MAYYKQTSPLIGYYYAKEMLSGVNGLGQIEEVRGAIAQILDK